MRVLSINFNGIRPAYSKDLVSSLAQQETDIVCVQELKAEPQFERSIACKAPAIGSKWLIQVGPTVSAKDQQAKPLAGAEHFA